MNASLDWLRTFVPFRLSATELRDLLTARCATVDEVMPLRTDLAEIVIGRVVDASRHPDSDHLWITKVDAGGDKLHDVICGAPNVRAGSLYPFARVGTTLPGGMRIEKRKIRGAVSEGMLCSARELGLGTDHEGIMELEVQAPPGARFLDAVPAGDTRLVVDVLPNRPDLLSHEGLAREIAAATGLRCTRPREWISRRAGDVEEPVPHTTTESRGISVRVEDREGCPRYMTAAIRGLRVGPSPAWLAARVESVGGRSINNVVDVTNYMLHGFGQPMHAFDLARLAGGEVIVRQARAGEKLIALDSVERTLDPSMTVIADAETAHAVGGVIGGRDSEVTESTTDILLEAAAFDPARIRATRRKLAISTDASYRFERGIEVSAIPELLDYALEMLVAVAGGTVDRHRTDSIDQAPARRTLELRLQRVAQVLGERISAADAARYLSSVGFGATASTDDVLSVSVPTYRIDVIEEIDLIEEVARLHGYHAFSSELRPYRIGTLPDAPLHHQTERVREACAAAGLLEARPMPFVRNGPESHRIRNPLAADEAYLRTSILQSLRTRAEYNLAHMQRNVRLFEVGTIFTNSVDPSSGAPAERMHAGAVLLGDRRPAHFTEPHPPSFDEWDAKALAETMAGAAFPGRSIRCAPTVGDALWVVTVDGDAAGSVSRLPLDAPVWASAAFGVEIDLQAVPSDAVIIPRFRPFPSLPAIEVDLALIVRDALTAAQVEEEIRGAAGDLLEDVILFDEFRGAGVPEGSRSLAWRLTFRHPERTLREREIQGRTARILSMLEAKLGIRQRTS